MMKKQNEFYIERQEQIYNIDYKIYHRQWWGKHVSDKDAEQSTKKSQI